MKEIESPKIGNLNFFQSCVKFNISTLVPICFIEEKKNSFCQWAVSHGTKPAYVKIIFEQKF
jgi:hypothetical protein